MYVKQAVTLAYHLFRKKYCYIIHSCWRCNDV